MTACTLGPRAGFDNPQGVPVTPQTCAHGLATGECEICRVLGSGPGTTDPEPSPRLLPELRARSAAGLGVAAVVAVVVLVVVSQVIAVVGWVFRIVQLVAVAIVAGWIGWKAGVAYGRRSRRP